VSIARCSARRSTQEWGRLLEDRDRWRIEALEAERALAATTAELADALALAAMFNRRIGPRRLSTEPWTLSDLRADYGRRHDDTCRLSTCQCGAWNPTTRRYEVAL
jgi:hypothetical protein